VLDGESIVAGLVAVQNTVSPPAKLCIHCSPFADGTGSNVVARIFLQLLVLRIVEIRYEIVLSLTT